MITSEKIMLAFLFLPLAAAIIYMDIRYRRIPNKLVFAIAVAGITLNILVAGMYGLGLSIAGLLLAFALMLVLHVLGTMGAGDVKLFAAVGSLVGVSHVLPTLLIVAMTGGLFAICKMVYARRTGQTMVGVVQFFYGLLPGQTVPHFEVPAVPIYTLSSVFLIPLCT